MRLTLKFISLIFLSFFLLFNISSAQGLNAGFVNGLWYSKTPFFAGEEVRIYTVIQNQSGFDITGAVSFFDNGNLLGQSDFSIVNGRLIEKWADWAVFQGEHEISVKISNTKKIEIGKDPEAIDLISNLPISEKYDVDFDTDGDGVGNKSDTDDDNDGQTDEEEKIAGTNPLVFDKKIVPQENPKVTEQKKDSVSVNSEDTTVVEKIIDKTTEIAGSLSETFLETADNTKKVLEKEKEKIDAELVLEKKEEALKDIPKIDEDKNPYVASIIGSVPELKEIYSFLLAVLIYIFNSWWILLGSILVVLYFLWKMISKRLFRRSY